MMKNNGNEDILPSEFWKYIINKSKALLYDMNFFEYNLKKFQEKFLQTDQQFLSFIWAMKFIAYEEEIVDSNKKSEDIEKVLGIDIIEKFVKNKTDIFPNLYPVNSLVIKGPAYVLKDEIHDSRWVLGVIKKCIAHGNFSIDFNRGVFVIDNTEHGNELNCEVGCFWLAQLGNLITPERSEVINYTHLFLKPFMLRTLEKPLANESELEQFLNSNNFHVFIPLLYLKGTNEEKIKAKTELTTFWENVMKNGNLVKDIPTMTKEVTNGGFKLVGLGQKYYQRIISEIKNIKGFYSMEINSQQNMIETILYDIMVIELIPSQSHNIDFGLELLSNQAGYTKFYGYVEECNSKGKKIQPSVPRAFADYTYCYGTFKKKMALAYMLGVLLFSGNKEEIYDQYIDYDSFDLSKVKAFDYASGKEVQMIIDDLQRKISSLEAIEPKSKKINKKIESKKLKLSQFQSKLIPDADGIPKVRPSNKEIFHRLRNAFSHKQLFNLYLKETEENIPNAIDTTNILVKDEDIFLAIFNIDELLDILMSDKFYNALVAREQEHNKSI